MYFRRKTSAGRAYLQIVESRRDGDQVRQQVIATLGRYEELQASGQLQRLLQSGARFVAKAMVLAAAIFVAALASAVRTSARRSFGGASRPANSTVPAMRRPPSIGVKANPRVLLVIAVFTSIPGDGSMA